MKRVGLIIWPLFLAALIAAMVLSPRIMVGCKYILDSYAVGHSKTKSLLLLMFLLVLALLKPLPSIWKTRFNWWFPAGLLVLSCLSLGEYIYYCQQFQIPINQRSVLVFDGLQSSTRLEHLHTSKAVLGAMLPYSGQGFDLGAPFQAVFGKSWLLFHGMLFLMFCCLSVAMVHHHQKKLTFARGLCLALGLYPLVKGLVDGGPFAIEDAGRIGLLSAVFLTGKKRYLGLFVSLVILLSCLYIEARKGAFYNLFRFTVAAVSLALPLLLEEAWKRRTLGMSLALLGALSVTLGSPLFGYSYFRVLRKPPSAVATWKYGASHLKTGWTVNVVSRGSLPPSKYGRVMKEIQGDRLVVSRLSLAQDTTPFELCRVYSLNVARTPIIWYGQPGFVIVEGSFAMEDPSVWLKSETVLRYSFQSTPQWTTLVLEMTPGAQTNVACDVLPHGPFATRRVDLTYKRPAVKAPWRKGPGWK